MFLDLSIFNSIFVSNSCFIKYFNPNYEVQYSRILDSTLACEPQSSYLYDNKVEKLFTAANTAFYRGYWASWKLFEGKIYLIDIQSPSQISSRKGNDSDEPISTMKKLFPRQSEDLPTG